MQLKKALYHLQMKSDENISSYIARVKIAAANLRDRRRRSERRGRGIRAIGRLLDSYENLNMALASLPDDKFTSAEVKRVLLAEYDRRQSRLDDKAESPKEALAANKGIEDKKTKIAGNEKSKSVTCFNCRKVGHFARDCRLKKEVSYKKFGGKTKKDYDVS